MTKSTGEEWVGVPALAKELGVTMRTLYKLLDAGDLPAYRIGRVIRIKRVDVEAFPRGHLDRRAYRCPLTSRGFPAA